MSDVTIEIPLGSVEYLYADITANVTLDGVVEFGIGGGPDEVTWQAAAWVGDPDLMRSARMLLDGSLPLGQHLFWARVTDSPEIPIIKCGKIKIVNR